MADGEVYTFYSPIYKLAKCIYATSDKMKREQEPEQEIATKRTQQIRLTFSILIVGTFFIFTYFTYKDLRNLHRESHKIIMLNLDRVALTMEAIIIYVVYYTLYHQRNDLPRLLQIIENADKAIYVQLNERIQPGPDMYQSRKSFLIHMCLSAVMYFVNMCLDMVMYERIQLYNITRLFVTLVRECMIFQYVTILSMTYWRIKHVNTYLSKMDVDCGLGSSTKTVPVLNVSVVRELYRTKREAQAKRQLQKSLDDIKMCRILHDALCDVCKDLDDMFGFFHLFCIVTTAIEQISEAFSIFLVVREGDYGDVYTTIIRSVLQMYFNLYVNFYSVFYFCDRIIKESSLTKEIIQRFHLESEKNYLEGELRVFSMQLKHATLSFSALEYFFLDWELMIEINNDITSYFIFFIQYQINMDDKKDPRLHEIITTITSMLSSTSSSTTYLDTMSSSLPTALTTFADTSPTSF